MARISFKKGYKYQLEREFRIEIPILPPVPVQTDYVELTRLGMLRLAKGYAWDGPSGPTLDVPSFMRASLVHDALYQLMRNDWLDRHLYRKPADQLMHQLCLEDGMSQLWAAVTYGAVRLFGEHYTRREHRRPLLFAP